ncbi:single-stranded DNA-binding protein [uncultured Serinicoccus sp.]|uniref:single-stranded DNA-binding protein n=1 Tax=uncultured Serinicoccus sp. TaxID=735514 RepID=UPI0026094394|nr:single-stranded DNA-binding protein [uncultured Serinicoccus sp.]
MMNEPTITLSGNLTRDPERKTSTANGKDFAVVPIAVNRRRFDPAQDSWVTADTMFIDLLCFRHIGALALASFRKGDPVIAHGRLSLRDWKTETSAGTTAVVDVDTIGHDVSRGVSRFTKGRVGYDGDRLDEHDPTPPAALTGGLVGAAEQRTGTRREDGRAGGHQGAGGEGAPVGEDAGRDLEIEVDDDGVVADDAQADGVLARSA